MVTDLHDPPPGTLDVAALPGPHLRRELSQTTAHGGLHAERIPGVRRLPTLASRVQPDVALFQSWHGRYSDSPRAVAEELRRRGAPLEQVWVIADGCPAPDGAAIVRPGTLDYLRQLGRARYVVTNTTLPGYYRKKRSTTYLQTWHGTPLKRIALDLEQPRFAGGAKYLRDLRREAATWDYLVSPNAFSTPIFRRAFGYGGDVLETGYPRNDLLLSEEREALRARVRDELGLGSDAVAGLYAPPSRDDDAAVAPQLDLPASGRAPRPCAPPPGGPPAPRPPPSPPARGGGGRPAPATPSSCALTTSRRPASRSQTTRRSLTCRPSATWRSCCWRRTS